MRFLTQLLDSQNLRITHNLRSILDYHTKISLTYSYTMSSLTAIRARLILPEDGLQYLWTLTAQPYSQLIGTILEYLANHPDFLKWSDEFKLPKQIIQDFVKPLKSQSPYQDLPGRFLDSAVTLVHNIYLSWFAQRKSKLYSLRGKKRFFALLKSDEDLQNQSGYDLYTLAKKAQELLEAVTKELEAIWAKEGTEPIDEQGIFWQITNKLYEIYDKTKSIKKRCLVAYLVKNGNNIPNKPEDPKAFLLRYTRKRIAIERLEKQLQGSAPHPRIMEDNIWLEALDQSLRGITEAEDLENIQRQLLQKFPHIPYPVYYNSNSDLELTTNNQGCIFIKFNGLTKKLAALEIACDNRQSHFFNRILSDYQCHKKTTVPGGLMLLRSVQLIWKPTKEKGEPWKSHHLYLHCIINNRLWSKIGMEQVRQELIDQTEKEIKTCKAKGEEKTLTSTQRRNIKRLETSLEGLKNFDIALLSLNENRHPDSNPHIVIGVAIGLKVPVTISVINLQTKENLRFYSPKQLLSRTHNYLDSQPKKVSTEVPSTPRKKRRVSDYELFQQYLERRHKNKHQRHQAQKKFGDNQFGEADAGLYFSQLFAKAITEVAKTHQASVIVLPDLKNIREILEAEIRARAELKYPGSKTLQQKYGKDYRASVHQWNYNQLIRCITNHIAKIGLEIVTIHQIVRGNQQQKARNLVLTYWEKKQNPPKEIVTKADVQNRDDTI